MMYTGTQAPAAGCDVSSPSRAPWRRALQAGARSGQAVRRVLAWSRHLLEELARRRRAREEASAMGDRELSDLGVDRPGLFARLRHPQA